MKLIENIEKLERIKASGKVILIKLDGEREALQYVATIGFPKENPKVLSFQGDDLDSVITQLVQAYENEYGI